jgi:hypothetical protein
MKLLTLFTASLFTTTAAAADGDWTKLADWQQSFVVPANMTLQLRFGDGDKWSASLTLAPGTYVCDAPVFGDPAPGVVKHCEAKVLTVSTPSPTATNLDRFLGDPSPPPLVGYIGPTTMFCQSGGFVTKDVLAVKVVVSGESPAVAAYVKPTMPYPNTYWWKVMLPTKYCDGKLRPISVVAYLKDGTLRMLDNSPRYMQQPFPILK